MTDKVVRDDTARILLSAEDLIEYDPQLSREDAIHRAVELHFAPEHEPNEGFRAFLIQREAVARIAAGSALGASGL